MTHPIDWLTVGPKLLEALERVANHPAAEVEYIDYGPDRKQRIWPTVRQEAFAAIAAAKGETPDGP